MDLRPALRPREPSPSQLADAHALLSACESAIADGGPPTIKAALEDLNATLATPANQHEVATYHSATTSDSFLRAHLYPPPTVVPDVTDSELTEIIRRVLEASSDEPVTDWWLAFLSANIPDPGISDLIYWPEQYLGAQPPHDLQPSEILTLSRAPATGPEPVIVL